MDNWQLEHGKNGVAIIPIILVLNFSLFLSHSSILVIVIDEETWWKIVIPDLSHIDYCGEQTRLFSVPFLFCASGSKAGRARAIII